MVNGYLYTGPLPLGSVVAHNCGAAGLFSDKVHPEVILEAHEVEGIYTLTVTIGDTIKIFEGTVSSMGRRQIGQALLGKLFLTRRVWCSGGLEGCTGPQLPAGGAAGRNRRSPAVLERQHRCRQTPELQHLERTAELETRRPAQGRSALHDR